MRGVDCFIRYLNFLLEYIDQPSQFYATGGVSLKFFT